VILWCVWGSFGLVWGSDFVLCVEQFVWVCGSESMLCVGEFGAGF